MSREQRLVFGEDAERYDRARPSYPAELIDDVVAPGGGPCRALDVGCGTAKATVLLAERGVSGVGVEPDPAMAAVAAGRLRAYPAWTVTVCDFEDFDTETEGFDLVTSAQAWHWLDPVVRFAKAHRQLRPGGTLALWWNRPDADDSVLRRRIDAVYAEHFPTLSPHNILAAGRPPVGAVPPGVEFSVPVECAYQWVRRYSTREWTDLVQTSSDHLLLAADRLRPLLAALADAIDDHGGFYDHPYSCWLWTAQKL